MPKNSWRLLGEYLRESQLWGSIQNTLYWDQNTCMPSAGATWRGEQLSLLARTLHSRQSSERLSELIHEAKIELSKESKDNRLDPMLASQRSRNLELLAQDFSRQKSLDSDLVANIAIAKAEGYRLWQKARSENDFRCFAPALRDLIVLKKEQAKQLNEPRSCWETLAQPFEPGLSIGRVNELFEPLKLKLPKLIREVKAHESANKNQWELDQNSQKILCEKLLKEWSRDLKNTAVARSPHPFSITLGPNDFRITSRVVRGQPLSCFLATAHEWGHSLYEQGLPSETNQWFGWPLGQATSMAVHESQSLFWENRVAKSLEFANYFWSNFAQVGAPISSGIDLWFHMNPLSPGLNRVEADELSYGLHIMIRTYLEIALLEKDLPVEDLPEEWNKSYLDLLGISPVNDNEGCLQDVHWSEGMFGYFPSYLLGHLISAQLTETLERQLGPIQKVIEVGNFSLLIDWLSKNIYHFGRSVNAEELVKQVSSEKLSEKYFLDYLECKVEKLISK